MMCSNNLTLALLALSALVGCSEDARSSTSLASDASSVGSTDTKDAADGVDASASDTGAAPMAPSDASTSDASDAVVTSMDGSLATSPDAGNPLGGSDSGATATMSTDGGDSGLPVPGTCIGDWKAGTYPPDFITRGDALGGSTSLPAIGGFDYAVHVPKGYDCHLPTPILYGLHGLGMNGWSFNVAGTSTPMRKGGLVAKADEAGFILVMPTGMGPTDDAVKAVREIFKNLETHLNIDHKRVYATGHSFGGSLSYLIACTAADLFTAVAPNAWTMAPSPCNPARPISVLASDGDQDGIAPGGGDVTPAIKVFAGINGCSATAMPASVPASGPDTTCVTHPGCKNGVEVTGCTIKGGGHVWFGDSTCGTGVEDSCFIVGANSDYFVNTDFAWEFLKRFSR